MNHGKRLGQPYRRDTSLMIKIDGVWVRKLNEKQIEAFKQSVRSPQSRYRHKPLREKSK